MKGELQKIGHKRFGHESMDFYQCKDCSTEFPQLQIRTFDTYSQEIITMKVIACNGHGITICPWCREDSKPWHYGRTV